MWVDFNIFNMIFEWNFELDRLEILLVDSEHGNLVVIENLEDIIVGNSSTDTFV